MAEKNDIITAVAEGMGSGGEGIFKSDITYFVPYCLPGEKVRFKVLKVKGGIGYGKAEEVYLPAEERVRPKCPVFTRCGGCQLQHLEYAKQLEFKGKVVSEALKKIGHIEWKVPKAIGSDFPYGYRNKLQMPIGVDREGNTVVGFYAERSHRIIPTDDCAIHPDWAKKIIAILKKYIAAQGIQGYDEVKKTGSLRHLVVRELDGKFIITLVSATEKLPNVAYFSSLLDETFKNYTLWLNINGSDTNVIFGEKFILLKGEGFFEGEEKGVKYQAGPQTFVQVNANVRGKLYDAALKEVLKEGCEVVIDAYSGGGLLTAMIAKRAKRVYGIEVEKEAVACADAIKARNGLDNVTNICGKVEEKLFGVLEKERGEKLGLILDPPRAGIHRSVLEALKKSGIPRLVLISCNPATLARDLGILTGNLQEQDGVLVKGDGKGEYAIETVQPYDMFPQTKHVETLVQLSQKKPDSTINVKIEFGEGEGELSLKKIAQRIEANKPKEKVTYKMIQDYIEETYGFKVHTAYIAEVKRDLGLPMYDAPNAVEELKKPRQHPSEKMIKAIKETLKHFEII